MGGLEAELKVNFKSVDSTVNVSKFISFHEKVCMLWYFN